MAVVCRERVAELPTHNEAAVDVDNGIQLHEAVFHGDVADVHAPHLAGSCDGHPAQQIGMDILRLPSLGETFLQEYGQYAYLPQQASQTLGIGSDVMQGKHVHHRQYAGRGMLDIVPVHQLHDLQVLGTFALGLIVEVVAAQVHQLAEVVAAHAYVAVLLKLCYLTFRQASSQAVAKNAVDGHLVNLLQEMIVFRLQLHLLAGVGRTVECLFRMGQEIVLPLRDLGRWHTVASRQFQDFSFSIMASMATFALKAAVNLLILPIICGLPQR